MAHGEDVPTGEYRREATFPITVFHFPVNEPSGTLIPLLSTWSVQRSTSDPNCVSEFLFVC